MYNWKWREKLTFFFSYQILLYLFIKMLLRNYFCKLKNSIAWAW
jgi:hypothetical protein